MTRWYAQLNVRVSPDVYEAVEQLTKHYGTKTAVIKQAVKLLKEHHAGDTAPAKPKRRAKTGTSGKGEFLRYGKRHDPKRGKIDDPDEQETLRRMLELRGQGLSLKRIADTLNVEGRYARNGKPWKRTNIDTILRTAERHKNRTMS